ncbi:MAG: VOC family protein [Acidobacteria bacterium]|nr:VOC family protein [Acidobacteriota bacterium]
MSLNHFEIPVDNPERAVKFYSDVFGWKFQQWDGPEEYWLVTTGPAEQPGINGGLLRRRPGATTVNSIDVPSVDQYVATIEAKGGKTVLPKMAIPGVGWLAYCTDPDGNIFGIHQADPSAR